MNKILENLFGNKDKKMQILVNVFQDESNAKSYYFRNKKLLHKISAEDLEFISPYYINVDIALEKDYLRALNKDVIKNLRLLNLDYSFRTLTSYDITHLFKDKEFILNAIEFQKITELNILDILKNYKDSVIYIKDPKFSQIVLSMKNCNIIKIIEAYPFLRMINDTKSIDYLIEHNIDINIVLNNLKNVTDISINDLNKIFNVNFLNRLSLDSLNKLFDGNSNLNVYSNERLNIVSAYLNSNKIELLEARTKYNLPLEESNKFNSIYDALGPDYLKQYIISKCFGVTDGQNYETINNLKSIIGLLNIMVNSNKKEELIEKYSDFIEIIKNIISENLTREQYIVLYNSIRDRNYIQMYKSFINDSEKLFKSDFCKSISKIKNQEFKTVRYVNDGTGVYYDNIKYVDGENFQMLINVVSSKAPQNPSAGSAIIQDPKLVLSMNNDSNVISTSLISSENLGCFLTDDTNKCIIFGYDNVPGENILFMRETDAGLSNNTSSIEINNNEITTADNLIGKTINSNSDYNEVGILRINPNTKERINPTYIVCFNYCSELSVRAASKLNIPIYLINTKKYYRKNAIIEQSEAISNSHIR